MIALLFGLTLFHVLLLAGQTPTWLFVSQLGLFTIACLIQVKKLSPWPSLIVQAMVAIFGFVILFYYRTFIGVEAAGAFLTTVIVIRLLRIDSRESLFTSLFAFLFILTIYLVISDGVFSALIMITDVFLLFLLMGKLYQGKTVSQNFSAKSLLKSALTVIPIWLIFFLMMPRVQISLFSLSNQVSRSGFWEGLDPGQISELVKSGKTAFRARNLGTHKIKSRDYYWRGFVLTQSQGVRWLKGVGHQNEAESVKDFRRDFEVIIEPHYQRWLVGLDPSFRVQVDGDDRAFDIRNYKLGYTQFRLPLMQRIRYYLQWEEKLPKEDSFEAYLRTPKLSSQVQALVDEIRLQSSNHQQRLEKLIQFYKSGGFRYTLSPGKLAGDELEDFLFRSRQGFCEHFSGSFATLLRALGIPSRVILGFMGGAYNAQTGYITVGQQDAHAWVEYYDQEEDQWKRFDPVEVVEPLRVELGSVFFSLSDQEKALASQNPNDFLAKRNANSLAGLLAQWEGNLEYINAKWIELMLNYDVDAQRELLAKFVSFVRSPVLAAITLVLFFIATTVLFLKLSLHQQAAQLSQEEKMYLKIEKEMLRKFKLQRSISEGERSYFARLIQYAPWLESEAEKFLSHYLYFRYGGEQHRSSEILKSGNNLMQLIKNTKEIDKSSSSNKSLT